MGTCSYKTEVMAYKGNLMLRMQLEGLLHVARSRITMQLGWMKTVGSVNVEKSKIKTLERKFLV